MATQDVVRAQQAKVDPLPSGIVDVSTWNYLAKMCSRYS